MNKEEAYIDIKNKIMQMDYLPGEIVSENMLSDEYSLSRTPIRDIIKKLVSEELLIIEPQRGTYVTLIDTHKISSAIFLRTTLDIAIFDELINRDDLSYTKLYDNLLLQKELSESDYIKFHALDDDFHETIYNIAGKNDLYKLLKSYSVHYDRLRILFESEYDICQKVEDHIKIFDLLTTPDKSDTVHISDEYKKLFDRHLSPINTSFKTLIYNEKIRKFVK